MYDPIEDTENYIWNTFYFNRKDDRVFVPKRTRLLGWTLNFARVESYLIVASLLILPFIFFL